MINEIFSKTQDVFFIKECQNESNSKGFKISKTKVIHCQALVYDKIRDLYLKFLSIGP